MTAGLPRAVTLRDLVAMAEPGPLDPSETWGDAERRARQRERLARMLPVVLEGNAFYRRKLADAGIPDGPAALDRWASVPLTSKSELSADQAEHPPFGTNLSYPLDRYIRLHQTSGTTGSPLRILDDRDSWEWWARTWGFVYRAAGVSRADRVFFAFSFGPFIGFWSAFAGAEAVGALAISGGSLSSAERARAIVATGATALLCTPTYALRLAEAARGDGIDLAGSSLRVVIAAGEPGASVPAIRQRIEDELGAELIDHTGATEIGPTGFSCAARDGVHLIEREFVVEVLDRATGEVRDAGEGELVITNLGRWGSPAIRYRTGDLVRAVRGRCPCGRTLVKLAGGILDRADDMVTVRGVNVFPSALEAIVRRFDEVAEFRIELFKDRGMDELRCVVEPRGAHGDLGPRIADAIHRDIGLRVAVGLVGPGSLPRFEFKARRFIRGH